MGLTADKARLGGIDAAAAEISVADSVDPSWTYVRDPRGAVGVVADRSRRVLVGRGRARRSPASGSTRLLSQSGPSSRSMSCSTRSHNIHLQRGVPRSPGPTGLVGPDKNRRHGSAQRRETALGEFSCRISRWNHTATTLHRTSNERASTKRGCRARYFDERLMRGVDASWTSDGREVSKGVSRANTTDARGIDFSYRFGAAA